MIVLYHKPPKRMIAWRTWRDLRTRPMRGLYDLPLEPARWAWLPVRVGPSYLLVNFGFGALSVYWRT